MQVGGGADLETMAADDAVVVDLEAVCASLAGRTLTPRPEPVRVCRCHLAPLLEARDLSLRCPTSRRIVTSWAVVDAATNKVLTEAAINAPLGPPLPVEVPDDAARGARRRLAAAARRRRARGR